MGRARVVKALRREAGGLLAAPDEARGWLLRGALAVRRAVRRFEPDIVVSTGPPHSVHPMTGLGLRGSRVPWIADFRDPWFESARDHLDVAWWEPVVSRLESAVARSAEGVLTTTPDLADQLRGRFPGLEVVCFPNGADAEALPAHRPDPAGDFTVVHLGTVYRHRDPAPAVRAFSTFVGDGGSPNGASNRARLRFVGSVEGGHAEEIGSLASREGIADRVAVEPACGRDEALRILSSASVSLVLAQNQPTQVPGKVYEAVAMGLPTVVVTEPDSASGAAGRRLGAAVHSPNDVEGIAGAFRAAWRREWEGGPPSGVKVDYAELAADLEGALRGMVR